MCSGIVDDIEEFISKIPNSSNSIREFNIRCPICGDSKKNLSLKRMYISKEPPFQYFCHNCSASGILDQTLVNSIVTSSALGTPPDFEDNANLLIKKLSKFKITNAFNYNIPLSVDYIKELLIDSPSYLKSNNVDNELHYLVDRFGFDFDDEYVKKFRIILNTKEFLKKNVLVFNYLLKGPNKVSIKKNLKLLTDLIKQGHKFIGFITDDNSRIVFRTTTNSKFRYINISLLIKASVYVLKKDTLSFNDKIKISITEGIFDSISAYHNFDYDISIASLNANYITGIYKIMSLGIHYENCEVHIIVDNDDSGRRSLKSHKLLNMKHIFNIKFFINIKDKDIGTRLENIELVELN